MTKREVKKQHKGYCKACGHTTVYHEPPNYCELCGKPVVKQE